MERITGEVLGSTIIEWLTNHNLSLSNMRGQCYDGASNMSGARSGCKAIVQQAAPLAQYFHCASHRLNLAVVSASKITALRNAESYIGEISRFFSFSPKRQQLLEKAIDKVDPTPRAMKLKDVCRTRWVERIEAYATFLDLLVPLHLSLEAMVHPTSHSDLGTDWSWDGETITRANGFLFQLNSSSFFGSFLYPSRSASGLKGDNSQAPVCSNRCCASLYNDRISCVHTEANETRIRERVSQAIPRCNQFR